MNEVADISRGFPITLFLSGIMFAFFAAAGLFFFRFWKKTKEPFFLAFALACWMLSLERIPLALGNLNETEVWVYIFRLSAFLLIMLAIWRANRARKSTVD